MESSRTGRTCYGRCWRTVWRVPAGARRAFWRDRPAKRSLRGMKLAREAGSSAQGKERRRIRIGCGAVALRVERDHRDAALPLGRTDMRYDRDYRSRGRFRRRTRGGLIGRGEYGMDYESPSEAPQHGYGMGDGGSEG